ncbi:uncharacterized protein EV422DRAFT_320234 [Fimicolochytrium jonesii]|uniref:uncharacterized protein n=1 Tax=Fimicolochytrium jonesii TaxID=1396493 RepID=UPI0022FE020F|nr:uncharacterized protein EV422DRAFT_320234 [Fimicolochytrium jonesii]KAI8824428.1 hypothetical protein EV422DRAFT_320234 [Fimicolochytrium jonesii]
MNFLLVALAAFQVLCALVAARALPARLFHRQSTPAPSPPDGVDGCAFTVYNSVWTFYIPTNETFPVDAADACESHGGALAKLEYYNFFNVSNAAYDCVGAGKQVVVSSWNGDDYGAVNITLQLGPTRGPGAVTALSTEEAINNSYPYLCQYLSLSGDASPSFR